MGKRHIDGVKKDEGGEVGGGGGGGSREVVTESRVGLLNVLTELPGDVESPLEGTNRGANGVLEAKVAESMEGAKA